MVIDGVEALDNALIAALDKETGGLFEQGDLIIEAIERGMDEKVVYSRFTYLSRRSKRTGEERRKVSTVFPPDVRNPELDYYMHVVCASAADLRRPETYDTARQWLNIAADGYMSPDGKQHQHSIKTLKACMRASGHEPDKAKDIYLLDGVQGCIVKVLDWYQKTTIIQIEVEGIILQDIVTPLENVMITLAQKR